MTILTVGQCVTHMGSEYAVSVVILHEGKISYTLIGLENATKSDVLESSMHHYSVADKVITLEELRSRRAQVQASIEQLSAETGTKAHNSDVPVSKSNDYADLLTSGDEPNSTKRAAKNIRTLLKKHFTGVKFSVRTRDYNCINVFWTDGPTKDAVEEVIGKFQAGNFDCMSDMYEYSITTFNSVYGSVQYLFTERSYSDSHVQEAIDQLRKEHGDKALPETVTVLAFRKGQLWSKGFECFSNGLQSAIHQKAGSLSQTK